MSPYYEADWNGSSQDISKRTGYTAFGLVSSDGSDHGYIWKSWMAVAGIYLFFFVDKILKFIPEFRKGRRRSKASKPDHETAATLLNNTSNGPEQSLTASNSASSTVMLLSKESGTATANGKLAPLPEDGPLDNSNLDLSVEQKDEQQAHGMCSHDHHVSFNQGDSVIATVAWMIIFGDGLHNFIDGLSIGAAFSNNILTGVSVSLAVLCEEFPHELGDVAILINAGMTMKQALTYNLLSAATCYVGFVIGVLLGELEQASPFIFALAGGMFLYISLASMVPEMNSASEKHLSRGLRPGMRAMGLQAGGVAAGLIAMFLMAYYGSLISIE